MKDGIKLLIHLIWRKIRFLPSAWLLVVQCLMLFITSMTNSSVARNAVAWFLGTIALLLITKIIRSTMVYTLVGLFFVIPSLILSIAIFLGDQSNTVIILANLFEACAYFSAAYGLIRYMFADRYLSRDELFAAANVFTLMAWGFAFIYSACQVWDISSFSLAEEGHARSWLSMIYLSFSVQSGVGLSDIVPHGNLARALVALQMFVGVMYLTLVVSRLVALQYIAHQPRQKKDD